MFPELNLNTSAQGGVRTSVLRLVTSGGQPKIAFVKNAGILLSVLLLASVGRLSAQVTVEILTDQDEFLPGEAIPVIARITNRSGQTLTFAHDKDWLKFSVQAHEGYVAMTKNDLPNEGEF